jgi:hypothetical protein
MMLRPGFIRFQESLAAACGSAAPTPDTAFASMLTGGTGHLASAARFPSATDVASPLARWLAALAIILAIVEMALRRARDGESEL